MWQANLLRILRRAHDNETSHLAIDHYLSQYGHVPLWVLANVLTFGNMAHFYALQRTAVRNATSRMISEASGVDRIGIEQLRTSISTLVDFRNVCAHDDRLYCARVGTYRDRYYRDLLRCLRIVVSAEEVCKYE